MEERFRDELRRYQRRPDGTRLTPRDIPPLISMTGSLAPTARNKMYHARIVSKNFGGQWVMMTKAPLNEGVVRNMVVLTTLLTSSKNLGVLQLGSRIGNGHTEVRALKTTHAELLTFLKDYRWLETEYVHPERPQTVNLLIEFLENQKHGITSWIVLAPTRATSYGSPVSIEGLDTFSVKKRRRSYDGQRFEVYGEPAHRTIAQYLACLDRAKGGISEPTPNTVELRKRHQGVVLLYLVREHETDPVSVGFEVLCPDNDEPNYINYTADKMNEE